jgi:DNA repair photolyase
MDIREIQSKTVLVKSGIPGVDYVVNPYTGCQFACKYCYASFMGRFVDRKISEWGTYVYAKTNAPAILHEELARLSGKGAGKEIFFSSVTDPYQGVEGKYRLTRGCLDEVASSGFAGTVSILTKSPLVTRDMDVFRRLGRVMIGLTVTSTDDTISRYFETNAPPVTARLAALKRLRQEGIPTYAFVGPLLPHYVDRPDELERVFSALAETGTRELFVEHLNLAGYIRERLLTEMRGTDEAILSRFYASQTVEYRERLQELVRALVAKYGLRLITDTVIFHQEYRQRNPIGGVSNRQDPR